MFRIERKHLITRSKFIIKDVSILLLTLLCSKQTVGVLRLRRVQITFLHQLQVNNVMRKAGQTINRLLVDAQKSSASRSSSLANKTILKTDRNRYTLQPCTINNNPIIKFSQFLEEKDFSLCIVLSGRKIRTLLYRRNGTFPKIMRNVALTQQFTLRTTMAEYFNTGHLLNTYPHGCTTGHALVSIEQEISKVRVCGCMHMFLCRLLRNVNVPTEIQYVTP